MAFKWQRIENQQGADVSLFRAKIPGGWLVVLYERHLPQGFIPSGSSTLPENIAADMVFISDPQHQWDGNTLPD